MNDTSCVRVKKKKEVLFYSIYIHISHQLCLILFLLSSFSICRSSYGIHCISIVSSCTSITILSFSYDDDTRRSMIVSRRFSCLYTILLLHLSTFSICHLSIYQFAIVFLIICENIYSIYIYCFLFSSSPHFDRSAYWVYLRSFSLGKVFSSPV